MKKPASQAATSAPQFACEYSEWRFERVDVREGIVNGPVSDDAIPVNDPKNITSNYLKIDAENGTAASEIPYSCSENKDNPPSCIDGGLDSFKYSWTVPPKSWTPDTSFTAQLVVDCSSNLMCTSSDNWVCKWAQSDLQIAYPYVPYTSPMNCSLPHIPGGDTSIHLENAVKIERMNITDESDKQFFRPYWSRMETVPCDQVEPKQLFSIETWDGARFILIRYLYKPIPANQQAAPAAPPANGPSVENPAQPPAAPPQENPQPEAPAPDSESSSSDDGAGLLVVGGLGLAIAGGLGLGATVLTNIVLTRKNTGEDEDAKAQKDQIVDLQFSILPGAVRLKKGLSESVAIQSIAVYRSGKRVLAPASLSISSASPCLSVSPQNGSGALTCRLTQVSGSDQPTATVIVRGTYAQFSKSASFIVELENDTSLHLDVHCYPDRKVLLPDGKDTVGLYARVCGADPSAPPGDNALAAHKTIEFQLADDESKKWLCESIRQDQDGWWVYGVQATNLEQYGEQFAPVHPPKTQVYITVTARTEDGQILQEKVGFTIQELPTLDAKPDHFKLAAKSKDEYKTEVWINDPWEAPWDFDCDFRENYRAMVKPVFSEKSGIKTTLTMTNAQLGSESGQGEETTYLQLSAKREGMKTVERYLTITLVQEGLFVDPDRRNADGTYRINGDGNGIPTEIDFRVLVRDEASGEMIYSRELAKSLVIENISPENSMGLNASQTGDLKWALSDSPKFEQGIRESNNPSAVWRFWLPFAIPGDNRIPKVEMEATVEGKEDEAFTANFTLGIEMTGIESGSTDWKIEYNRCQKIIFTYIPLENYSKVHDILERKSKTLGPEGMFELRKRIWEIAQNLTLGEGGQGWRDAGRWEGYIETSLEVIKLLSDIAFGIVGGMAFGMAAIAADILRDTIRTAIVAFIQGKGIDEWLDDELAGLKNMIVAFGEGHLIDVDLITRIFQKNPKVFWIAWSIFVTLDFLKNLYQKRSLKEAIKESIKDVAMEVVARWLFGHISKSLGAGEGVVYKNWNDVPDDLKKRFNNLNKRVVNKDGKPYASPEDVLELQRDTRAMRSLKQLPEGLQEAFNNTLHEKIYAPVNEAIKKDSLNWVRNNIPGMKNVRNINVRVDEFRTPGVKASGINTDHDFRVQYLDKNGNWIEVDRRAYNETAARKFAEVTGFDPNSQQVRDMLPEDIAKKWDTMTPAEKDRWWSDKHGQLATDKYHVEASPDFSDQVIDPATGKRVRRTPNIVQVQAGHGKLIDPGVMARMEAEKIADQVIKGNLAESIAQAQKGIKLLEGVRRGYSTQGFKIGEIPNNLQKAFDLIRKSPADLRATPEKMTEFTKELKRLGFGNMQDFAQKFGSQYEALKMVKK
ncbi:MAG: hypothetical protein AB9891_18345 [Anaerolineaceae bacterium]